MICIQPPGHKGTKREYRFVTIYIAVQIIGSHVWIYMLVGPDLF